MKRSPKQYAAALAELFLEGKLDSKALANFKDILRRKGENGKALKVAESFSKITGKKFGYQEAEIFLARELGENEKNRVRKSFGEKVSIKFRINPAIVAGAVIVLNGERRVDASVGRRIKEITKIISN